jgi:hypothetical protein
MSSDSPPASQGMKRFCRVNDPAATNIVSRSKLYEMAAEHHGLLLKLDAITVVDLAKLDEILASLPAAELSPRRRKREGV